MEFCIYYHGWYIRREEGKKLFDLARTPYALAEYGYLTSLDEARDFIDNVLL